LIEIDAVPESADLLTGSSTDEQTALAQLFQNLKELRRQRPVIVQRERDTLRTVRGREVERVGGHRPARALRIAREIRVD